MSIRMLGRMAAAGLVFAWLAAPASADGLSRFEQALKDAPNGAAALTYKNAKALGDSGFTIEDVVLTPSPDKAPKTEPILIKRIMVEDFDFASTDKKLPPNFIKIRAEGIAIAGKPAEGVDLKDLAGIDKITADFQLDYRYDPDRKTLSLNRLELDVAALARLELSFVVDGVSPDQVGKPEDAMKNATLRTATFAFEDRSLLSKVVPAAAKMQSTDADAMVKLGRTMLVGLREGQGPEALAVIDAVVSYMDDYKQPKGPLKITLNPPAKLSQAVLMDAKTPDQAIKALGLVVSYVGTKPGAPAGGATAASAPAAGPAAKPGCTPGARFFVMHEDAYWAVTAREAKGGECVARIDGDTDDLTFAIGKSLAWSIDGPGKAVAKCNAGDKVVAYYKDGGWYPAEITTKPFAEGKCPVKYESDDSEDTLELKKIRKLD